MQDISTSNGNGSVAPDGGPQTDATPVKRGPVEITTATVTDARNRAILGIERQDAAAEYLSAHPDKAQRIWTLAAERAGYLASAREKRASKRLHSDAAVKDAERRGTLSAVAAKARKAALSA